MRRMILGAGVLAIASIASAASVYDDNFNDGVRGSQWSMVVDDPAALNLVESGGVLNLVSTGGGVSQNDALYLSNFRISTASDFTMRIDYNLGGASGGATGDLLGLAFGVGADAEGFDSAAIGVGFTRFLGQLVSASAVGYRIDDAETQAGTETLSPRTGQLTIEYLRTQDTLRFTRSAATGTNFVTTLPDNLVHGTWQANDLLVSFGGRGSGFSSTAGQLTLDNFTIVPEPASLGVLASSTLLLRRRRV